MAPQRPLLEDRDPRRRPRIPWNVAWADASHQGGTISTVHWIRGAIRAGGPRAVALPAAIGLLLVAAFVAIAFGAALLAGSPASTTGRGALLILASVLLSQVLTLAQNQHPLRRLLVAAEIRATTPPNGWGRITINVASRDAGDARRALRESFPFVDVIYHRGRDAELRAWTSSGGAEPWPDLEPATSAALDSIPHGFCQNHLWGSGKLRPAPRSGSLCGRHAGSRRR